jgi:hypothetical protein
MKFRDRKEITSEYNSSELSKIYLNPDIKSFSGVPLWYLASDVINKQWRRALRHNFQAVVIYFNIQFLVK